MKYNLIKLVRNTKDQYSATFGTYDTLRTAKVAYHSTLAAYHNADDVKTATCKIIDEYGHSINGFEEIVDHTEEETTTTTTETTE